MAIARTGGSGGYWQAKEQILLGGGGGVVLVANVNSVISESCQRVEVFLTDRIETAVAAAVVATAAAAKQ